MDNQFERPVVRPVEQVTLNEYTSIGNNVNRLKKSLKISKYVTVFAVTLIFVFSTQVLISGQSSTSWFSFLPIIKQLKDFAQSADKKLKGEDHDRINILLLGIGGKGHDGAYLTDTMMLASIEPSTKKVALISIPRDMAIPIENMGTRKINSVDAIAEAEKPGSGGLATSQAVSDLLNIPIDYYVRVDFQGFINIIDALGGINVYVDNTLDDYTYPVLGMEDAKNYDARYEHLHIEKGWQKMDGTLALKYARSRHAYGVEGSDFARSARQQKIMQAAKDEVLSVNTILNPMKVSGIINEAMTHVDTNLELWELVKLWNNYKDTKKENVVTKVLDNSGDGLLVSSINASGAYVLTPRSGDFTEIQYMVNSVFTAAPETQKAKVVSEKSTVEIRNGTWINGLASKSAVDLEKYGFKISRIANSSRQNFETSVIYDLTYGAKMESLSALKEKTGANISYGLPEWLSQDIANDAKNYQTEKPDFILILGQNADKTKSGSNNPEDKKQ